MDEIKVGENIRKSGIDRMPDKPLTNRETFVSVLRARLRGEKDVSIRKYIKKKIRNSR